MTPLLSIAITSLKTLSSAPPSIFMAVTPVPLVARVLGEHHGSLLLLLRFFHAVSLISLTTKLSSSRSILNQLLRRDVSGGASLSAMSNFSSSGFSCSVISGLVQDSSTSTASALATVPDTSTRSSKPEVTSSGCSAPPGRPHINPTRSSSSSPIPSTSPLCRRLDSPRCNLHHQTCFCLASYGEAPSLYPHLPSCQGWSSGPWLWPRQ